MLAEVSVGMELSSDEAHRIVQPILSNKQIFGVDLYTTPLAAKVEGYFIELVAGPGAVRSVLDREYTN